MKKLWFPLMLLFILLNVSACNAEQECPVEVQLQTGTNVYFSYDVVITSVTDSVTINDIIVNRGNSESRWARKPIMLKFGKRTICSVVFPPKEIEVQTDMGNWTFRF